MTEMPTSPTVKEPADLHSGIAALEAGGAGGFDPVRFRFIKTMALRSRELEGAVGAIVAAKAEAALKAYENDLSRARAGSIAIAERVVRDVPAAAAQVQQYLQAGEFGALQRLEARLRRPSGTGALRVLTQSLNQHPRSPDAGAGPGSFSELLQTQETDLVNACADTATGRVSRRVQDPVELKSAGYFRETLRRQLADRLVNQVVLDAPADSGPLNPQMLAVRSLAAMRELSPRYLGRFVSYVDTLFWLEKAGEKLPP